MPLSSSSSSSSLMMMTVEPRVLEEEGQLDEWAWLLMDPCITAPGAHRPAALPDHDDVEPIMTIRTSARPALDL